MFVFFIFGYCKSLNLQTFVLDSSMKICNVFGKVLFSDCVNAYSSFYMLAFWMLKFFRCSLHYTYYKLWVNDRGFAFLECMEYSPDGHERAPVWLLWWLFHCACYVYECRYISFNKFVEFVYNWNYTVSKFIIFKMVSVVNVQSFMKYNFKATLVCTSM